MEIAPGVQTLAREAGISDEAAQALVDRARAQEPLTPISKLGLAGGRRVEGANVSIHRMARIELATGRVVAEFNSTKTQPWIKKSSARAKSKAARKSRKKNR